MSKITYELALELKDAGFLQGDLENTIGEDGLPFSSHGYGWNGNYAYIPSFIEILNECGKDFRSLHRSEQGLWRAKAPGGHPTWLDTDPETTMARFWLELKKRNK